MLPFSLIPPQSTLLFAGKRRLTVVNGQPSPNTPKGTQPPLTDTDIERLQKQAQNNRDAKQALNKANKQLELLSHQLEEANRRADATGKQLEATKKKLNSATSRQSLQRKEGPAASKPPVAHKPVDKPSASSNVEKVGDKLKRPPGNLSPKNAARFLEDLMAERGYHCSSCDFPSKADADKIPDPKALKPLFTFTPKHLPSLGPSEFQLKVKPLQQHTRQAAAAEAARNDMVCFTCKEESTRYPEYFKNKGKTTSRFPSVQQQATQDIQRYAARLLAKQQPIPANGSLNPSQAKQELLRVFGNECNGCEYPPPAASKLMPEGLLARLLQFHHKVPADKSFTISNNEIKKRPFGEVLEEAVRKCILLCANCHNMAHQTPDLLKSRLSLQGKKTDWL